MALRTRRPPRPAEGGHDGTHVDDLRSRCPIAGALDLLGDRWTLLVVRDLLFYGKTRFAEFLASPEGISTNILAERLARLEGCGLVERRRYLERPARDEYHPTARCRDLVPVLRALIRWGQQHVPGTARRPPAGTVTAEHAEHAEIVEPRSARNARRSFDRGDRGARRDH